MSQTCPICRDNSGDNELLKTIRNIIKNHNIPDAEVQYSAIEQFTRGQMSYAQMRSLAG
jgi:hypothetical protein